MKACGISRMVSRNKRIDAIIQVEKSKIHIKFEVSRPGIYGTRVYDSTHYMTMFIEQSDNYDNKILELLSLCREFDVNETYLDCNCKFSNTILETIKKFSQCNKVYMQYSPRFVMLN